MEGVDVMLIGINPEELKVEIIGKPIGEVVVSPRKFFVKITHIPTGLTVTRVSRSQLKAKQSCIEDLFWLLDEYNE